MSMGTLADLVAVVLAGGFGTRLRSVVPDRQKVLVQVKGRPFLAYLLDRIAAAGIGRVVLCLGFRGEQVREAFGDTYRGLAITYSQESRPLGTAGALRLALPTFGSDPVLVMNGDSYCECDLEAFREYHDRVKGCGTILVTKVEEEGRYGRVILDDNGLIRSFVEKDDGAGRGWINAGVYLLRRTLLADLPPHQVLSIERDVFPRHAGDDLYGFPGGGRFLDVGTPDSYAKAESFFEEYKWP